MDYTWHIWVIKVNKFYLVEKYIKEIPEIKEYLYPTAVKEYKSKTGVKKRRVPLYSGYLFIQYIDTPEIFYKLNTYPFITTYVGLCSGKDLELVRNVRNLELLNTTDKAIHVDDFIRVNSGPFKDFQGYVISSTSSNACVLLSVFGRDVSVSFIKEDIDIIRREGSV